jgi:acetylornithine deacetylase/succinyl-diaminopimelate desuccinylase-like protein
MLVYWHYDVQPPDPLSEWISPPFQPAVRSDNLYGRGACDDKGQLFMHVKAIESYLRVAGRLPVNVKCLFEGEEEIGSPNLTGFIERNRRVLAANFAVMSDTRMLGPNCPSLTYSVRGQLGLEIEVRGPRHDLHSGNFGGAVHDPLQVLCEMIARLHHGNGRVAIPGFYDRVRRSTEKERDFMQRSGPSDRQILHDAETETGWGKRGYSLYERVTVRPSLTINGISGGYEGVGGKAVIPSRALAKLSFRLVPDQDPREIETLFRRYIARIIPPTVKGASITLCKRSSELDHAKCSSAPTVRTSILESNFIRLRCSGCPLIRRRSYLAATRHVSSSLQIRSAADLQSRSGPNLLSCENKARQLTCTLTTAGLSPAIPNNANQKLDQITHETDF